MATLIVLDVFLKGGALLCLCDIYQNHVARDCGAECSTPPSDGTAEGRF